MSFSAILKQCENLVSIDNQNTKTQKREWGNVRRKFAHIFGGLCFQERQLAWMLGEDSVLRERRLKQFFGRDKMNLELIYEGPLLMGKE